MKIAVLAFGSCVHNLYSAGYKATLEFVFPPCAGASIEGSPLLLFQEIF